MTLATAKPFAVAAYTLDEESGVRADQVDGHNLGVVGGTVGFVPGKFGNAASFAVGALSRGAVIPGISMIRVWIKPSAAQSGVIVTQGVSGVAPISGITLSWLDFGAVTFALTQGFGSAVTFVNCDPDVWSLIHAWIDTTVPGTVTVGTTVNAGIPSTQSGPFAVPTHNTPFDLGGQESLGLVTDQYVGGMDDLVLMGGGQFLDAGERTADWNNGAGVAFADWDFVPPKFPAACAFDRGGLSNQFARRGFGNVLDRGGLASIFGRSGAPNV